MGVGHIGLSGQTVLPLVDPDTYQGAENAAIQLLCTEANTVKETLRRR